MELMLRAPSSRGGIKLCRYLLVSSVLLMELRVIKTEECDEIAKSHLHVLQCFFSTKMDIHEKCRELRFSNSTDSGCSKTCNTAIEQFFEKCGADYVRDFFSCECTEGSTIYPPNECAIDRQKLIVCPALNFMLQTSTEADSEEHTTTFKTPTTTAMTSTAKPFIGTRKNCRTARLDCQKTLSCSKAYFTVKDFCLDDFNDGTKCTIDCRKAMDELDMFPAAEELWGCECDPSSQEATWCPMYGSQGLKKTCEGVKYKELGAAKVQENEELKGDDPDNSSKHHVMSRFNCLLIPVLILTVLN